MSKLVATMKKIKTEVLIHVSRHNERLNNNYSNDMIDKSRTHLNYDLTDREKTITTDVNEYINNTKSTSKAIRKDAVLVNEWIISSDQQFFKDLNEKERRTFFEVSYKYFCDKFGKENVRYAIVHLDETTPHMHLGVVPFTKDKRLSAKTVFNKTELTKIQEELPKKLQERNYKIERGVSDKTRKALTVPEFKRLSKELAEKQKEFKALNDKISGIKKDLDTSKLEELLTLYPNTLSQLKIGKFKIGKKDYTITQKQIDLILNSVERQKAINLNLEKRLNFVFSENDRLGEKVQDLSEEFEDLNAELKETRERLHSAWKDFNIERAKVRDLEMKLREKNNLLKVVADIDKSKTPILEQAKTKIKKDFEERKKLNSVVDVIDVAKKLKKVIKPKVREIEELER